MLNINDIIDFGKLIKSILIINKIYFLESNYFFNLLIIGFIINNN